MGPEEQEDTPMLEDFSRRSFLRRSLATSTGAAMAFGFEDKNLLARADETEPAPPDASALSGVTGDMPMGKIKDLQISRVICGGNLISGFAHSRDLIYVSSLLRNYFTDERILDTFAKCEEHGINTAILRMDERTVRVITKYWKERGGKLQWIAQIKPRPADLTSDADQAIEKGAVGVYIQGETGDAFVRDGNVELLGKVVEHIRDQHVVAGIGAHAIEVIVESEKAGLNPDFYMKTFNAKNYWSAGPAERHDSVWEETPEQTRDVFRGVDKPWIAFKVLGAGAITPKEGFNYALENGADFLCVGMFDFQIQQDAAVAREVLSLLTDRERPWRG